MCHAGKPAGWLFLPWTDCLRELGAALRRCWRPRVRAWGARGLKVLQESRE